MENMFKKTVVLSVAVALIMLGLFVDPSAAQVTSVSKRGSFLVLPKINTFTSSTKVVDTIVTIGNDASSATWVKCYWMDSDQSAWDFEFPITANQPVWFSAKTGQGSVDVSEFGDNKTGELKCWAIDIDPPAPATTEIKKKFNYLYGSAIIVESAPLVAAFEYQAWAFNLTTLGTPNGPLSLNGTEYDYCPSYLVYNFVADDLNPNDIFGAGGSYLSLSPCQQDLRQDRLPVCTKAQFDIWNENEIKFTGAYQCVKCYFEGELADIGTLIWNKCDLGAKCKKTGVGGNKFTNGVLHTEIGRFRVTPSLSTACNSVFSKFGQDGKTPVDVCSGNQGKYPFLGVLAMKIDIGADTLVATTGTQAGQFTAGTQVLWDAADVSGAAKR